MTLKNLIYKSAIPVSRGDRSGASRVRSFFKANRIIARSGEILGSRGRIIALLRAMPMRSSQRDRADSGAQRGFIYAGPAPARKSRAIWIGQSRMQMQRADSPRMDRRGKRFRNFDWRAPRCVRRRFDSAPRMFIVA